MTDKEMKRIIAAEVPFDALVKDSGIYVFYEEGNLCAGISYETDDAYGDDRCERYIFNLFLDDEYINVECFGNGDNNETVHELVETWNQIKNQAEMSAT